MNFRVLTFCAILMASSFCGLEASLKSHFVDKLCHENSRVVFSSISLDSGVVQFLGSYKEPVDCEIVWRPGFKVSPVLSIVSYNLHPQDELIITDSDRFSVKLVGSAYFLDERKAFVSEGDLTVRFKSNHTRDDPFDRVKFHFVYTMARRPPCAFNEFVCKNGMCIDENLVCDSHNHCGDRSDQKKCVPITEKKVDHPEVTYASTRTNPWIVTVIVGAVILGVVLLALISVFIRQSIKKKKESTGQAGPTPSANGGQLPASFFTQIRRSLRSTRNPSAGEPRGQLQNNRMPSAHPPIHTSPSIATTGLDSQQPRPSFISQVKKSFRSAQHPKIKEAENELQRSENFETPSMYPDLPSAPELSGIDNPDFRAEEISYGKI